MNIFCRLIAHRHILLLFCCLTTTSLLAEDAPDNIPNTTKINAEQLFKLAEKYPELVIIDSRISGDRNKGYIEDSVSLPDIHTTCDTLQKFINSKTTHTLFYCNGVKCGRSVNAIKIAQACGYSNIYWFRGGFEEWLNNGLPYLLEQ